MIYKHPKFQIDTDSQIVYSEQGDELRVYGKEYLMLDKLCEVKQISHSEMADLLGFGELYIGKELKEIMQRINAKVNGEVVRFDGENFRLQGELKQASEIEHPSEEVEKIDKKEEKAMVPMLQKSLGLIIMIGVCILVAVWLIKFLLDNLI